MEAQENRKKLEALEDKLECMIYQKSLNDPTAAYCKLPHLELKNLSTESFEDFQVETFFYKVTGTQGQTSTRTATKFSPPSDLHLIWAHSHL